MFNKNNFKNGNFDNGLVEAVGNRLGNDNYKDAVKEAILYLTHILRNKTGLDLDGNDLVAQAFNLKNPKIQVNSLKTVDEQNEQKGVILLGQAIYAFRNPINHNFEHSLSEKDCMRQLLIIDMMLDYINREVEIYDKLSNVLFEKVDKESQEFYLHRQLDKDVKKILRVRSLWLYGESGTGKTSSAIYYTIQANQFSHIINFSDIEQGNIENISQNIYESLEDRAYVEGIDLSSIRDNIDFERKLKKIICLFTNQCGKVTLIFDDLQALENEVFHDFFHLILSILQNHSNGEKCNLKNLNVILTSIITPIEYFIMSPQKQTT